MLLVIRVFGLQGKSKLMKTNSIIVDYGVGNLYSLKKAIEFTGHSVIISRKVEDISNATHIFLPGVGSFYKASETLKQMNLFNLLKPVNSDTGRKNPTVINGSWGYQAAFSSGNTVSYKFQGATGTFTGNAATSNSVTAMKNGLNNQVVGAYRSWSSSSRSNSSSFSSWLPTLRGD